MGSQTLCEHIGDLVSQVAGKVLLVGHPERYAHLKYPCLADLHPDQGPLSGLETALSLEIAQFCVVTSCDVGNLRVEWLRALLWEAEASAASCVVARDAEGTVQPLCAVYRRDCLPMVSNSLARGNLRMLDLLECLNAKPVRLAEVVFNLNTPEQYGEIVNAHRDR